MSRKAEDGKASSSGSSTWETLKKLLGFGKQCENGGENLSDGGCRCRPYYGGEYCEIHLCLNGGRLSNGRCLCPDPQRFLGRHCERIRCDNGGRDTGKGYCECMDQWYHGKYCEQYSGPWGMVFGVMAGVLLLLVIVCVVCKLWTGPSGSRRRSRRSDTRETTDSERCHQFVVARRSPALLRMSSLANTEMAVSVDRELSVPPPYPGVPKPESPPPAYDDVVMPLENSLPVSDSEASSSDAPVQSDVQRPP